MSENLELITTGMDDYMPSVAERKLLETLLNPESATLNITELCQKADISRETYYKLMKKPEFKKLCREMTLNLIEKARIPITNAFIKEAKSGSYVHGKLLFEMMGDYRNSAELKINPGNESGYDNLTDEDFETKLIDIVKQNPKILEKIRELRE